MDKPRISIQNGIQLRQVVAAIIKDEGPECDLNHLDVSKVWSLAYAFEDSLFNGDISQWDTSNARSMERMFHRSKFNGDISGWDVSNTKDFLMMFMDSAFAGDVSKWNVSSATRLEGMFYHSQFKGDLSRWDFPEDANVRMLLHKSALPKTTAPSQYHWLMALSEKVPQHPVWRAHLEEYIPMVQSLQMTPAAGARAIQQLWLQRQLGADASLSVDTESFALPDLDAVLK